jgi:hypothetical protein
MNRKLGFFAEAAMLNSCHSSNEKRQGIIIANGFQKCSRFVLGFAK